MFGVKFLSEIGVNPMDEVKISFGVKFLSEIGVNPADGVKISFGVKFLSEIEVNPADGVKTVFGRTIDNPRNAYIGFQRGWWRLMIDLERMS